MDTVLRMLFDSIPRECSTNAYKTTLLSEVGSLLRSCRNVCFANCRILWIFQRHSRGLTVQRSDFFQPKAVSLCYMQQVFWLIAPLLGLPILSTVTLKIMNIGLRITAAGLCQSHTGFPKTECDCKGTTKNAHTQVNEYFFIRKYWFLIYLYYSISLWEFAHDSETESCTIRRSLFSYKKCECL